MEDPNIVDIDSKKFMELENILENKSTRDQLLRTIPPNILTPTDIELMENESYRHHMTTAKWLLFKVFGKKEVRVSEFVQWLEEAKLEKALLVLKKDVPLKIIEQPASVVNVQFGAKLSLICKATGWPSPDYQWFKAEQDDLKELLLQQDQELRLDSVKDEDSGFYVCLVSKSNLDPDCDTLSYIYSNPAEVVVQKKSTQSTYIQEDSLTFPKVLSESVLPITEKLHSYSVNSEKQSPSNAEIRCRVIDPKAMVAQGQSILLQCRAKYIDPVSKKTIHSSHLPPINYLWYKNGQEINGATSPYLRLDFLFPDPDTQNKKSTYLCKAFNISTYHISNPVEVALENETKDTPHFASEKYAFMIANDTYDHLPSLKTPAKDVGDLGEIFERMEFKVFAYRNLNLTEMKNAFNKFYSNLERDCYVVIFFAGHGFQHFGQVYLQPVDCNDNYDPQKAISIEEILECLQTRKPALNVLLLDCCRNPPQFSCDNSPLTVKNDQSYEIFKAKMGSNSVYGYSTSFLYSSHECEERNSFFVKYLKKHVSPDEGIFEILFSVQRDFKGDSSINNIQCPEIRTTLAGNYKFGDEILRKTGQASILKDMIRDLTEFPVFPFKLPLYESIITFKVSPNQNVFLNDIEISVSFKMSRKSPVEVLDQIEIDLISNMQEIQLLPNASICLKDIDKRINDNILLLKKQAFGIQRMLETLDCKLLIKFPQLKKHLEKDVIINVKSICDLKLSVNYLGSLVVEKT